MAAGDAGFCANYRARGNIDALIRDDPGDFYVRYRIWESKNPLPTTPAEMLTYFGEWETSENELNAGDYSQGLQNGGVRSGSSTATSSSDSMTPFTTSSNIRPMPTIPKA